MNIFEKAVRTKLRFQYRGILTVEDLWDLDVDELDVLYGSLKKEENDKVAESLLHQTGQNKELRLKVELVTYIVQVKLDEAEKQQNASERRAQKELLTEILQKRQEAELLNLSEEELLEKINAL
jgi:hypothetical protein